MIYKGKGGERQQGFEQPTTSETFEALGGRA